MATNIVKILTFPCVDYEAKSKLYRSLQNDRRLFYLRSTRKKYGVVVFYKKQVKFKTKLWKIE